MIKNIIFLKPFLVEQSWGGNDFKQFGYFDNSINAGELILLSDSGEYSNEIINSTSSITDIGIIYKSNKSFFNSSNGKIPYQIKIINPKITSPLLFTPNNYNSYLFSGLRSKKKVWISLKDNSSINFDLIENSTNAINETLYYNCYNEYQPYCKNIILKKYEGIIIPHETIHSIEPDSLIYEISYSDSYEYNLLGICSIDDNEIKCIEKSMKTSMGKQIDIYKEKENGFIFNSNAFRVQIINHIGLEYYEFKDCTIAHIFILEGEGRINSYKISKGSNLVIKSNEKFMVVGSLKFIITYIKDMK